jgi:hypothetical protein
VRRFLARTIPTSDRAHIIPDVSLSDVEPSGVKRTDGTRSAVAGGMAVTVTGTAADPLTWIVLGEAEHGTPAGIEAQESVTVPVKFAMGLNCRLYVAVPPGFVVAVVGPLAASMKGALPVPLTAAVWGEPAALSLTLSIAVRRPTACGENVTVIVQDMFTGTLEPHVFD